MNPERHVGDVIPLRGQSYRPRCEDRFLPRVAALIARMQRLLIGTISTRYGNAPVIQRRALAESIADRAGEILPIVIVTLENRTVSPG